METEDFEWIKKEKKRVNYEIICSTLQSMGLSAASQAKVAGLKYHSIEEEIRERLIQIKRLNRSTMYP
jgi:lambda repressor-like predicted transcriptional regulator